MNRLALISAATVIIAAFSVKFLSINRTHQQLLTALLALIIPTESSMDRKISVLV